MLKDIDKLKAAGFSEKEVEEHTFQKAGFSAEEIETQANRPTVKEAPFEAKHPNLYGMYGATKETLKTVVPYLKYVDPAEREEFLKLDQQHQTRDLLYQNLFAVLFAVPGTRGFKYGKEKVGAYFASKFPKTFNFLTKQRGLKAKPQPTAEPKVVTGADKVEQMYDESLDASKQFGKATPKELYRELKTKMVDTSGNVKADLLKQGDLGKAAVINHDLIAGATPKALAEYEAIAPKLFRDLSPIEETYLNRVIQSRRTIAIEGRTQIKHPKGLGATEHQEWLNSVPPELSQKLNQRADAYFSIMKNQLDELLNEGLITPKSHKALVAGGDYSPRKFLQHIDPERTFEVGGRKITVPDSGIQSLKGGSEGLLENNGRMLLEQVMVRTQNRVFRNRANKALYDIAEQTPDNGIVSLAKPKQKTPSGYERISTMVDGETKDMFMPKEIASEWVTKNPEISPQLGNFLGWISGSKILKPMATGLNPEFALTNFPRDIAHAWLTTQEYSSFAPKAALQMGRDIGSTLSDTLFRKGAWKNYINEGGGMSFLTHQGKITSKQRGVLRGVQSVLGWVGETSEIATRLMLRQRALRNGASSTEATWVARNYLDFSQGGSFAKAVDHGVPYLNAAIQGTRGIARAAAQKPGTFTFKVAQIGSFAAGLYMANRTQNPECWNQISDREKINNWVITTPFAYKDKDGTKKHVYLKIAKDQGQRVFATTFENLMAKYMGEEINTEQITGAIQDAIPMLPTDLMPPSLDATIGYAANKDFWRNKDIWRGPDIQPQEEYTRFTHPAFVKTGELTGLSPEKTKYALSQFFTSGNIYTSLVGHGWNKLLNESSEADRQLVTEEVILKHPFIRRAFKSTDPLNQYRREIKETSREAATEKHMITRTFDGISRKVYDKELGKKDLKTFINSMPITERKRLWERHYRRKELEGLPNKRWWLAVGGMSTPEAKAMAYWNKWRDSTTEERKKMDKTSKRLPWIRSGRFFLKLRELKKKKQP